MGKIDNQVDNGGNRLLSPSHDPSIQTIKIRKIKHNTFSGFLLFAALSSPGPSKCLPHSDTPKNDHQMVRVRVRGRGGGAPPSTGCPAPGHTPNGAGREAVASSRRSGAARTPARPELWSTTSPMANLARRWDSGGSACDGTRAVREGLGWGQTPHTGGIFFKVP